MKAQSVIYKLTENLSNPYPYNVQLMHSPDGGTTYIYSGEGRFFKTRPEAVNYINRMAMNPTTSATAYTPALKPKTAMNTLTPM